MEKITFKMGDVFPPDDVLGQWIAMIGIAVNDIMTANTSMIKEHDVSGDAVSPRALYFSRIAFAHLYEIGKRLKRGEKIPEIKQFLAKLPLEVQESCRRVIDACKEILSKMRQNVFHYPTPKEKPFIQVLEDVKNFQGEITFEGKTFADCRFEFADLIASNIAWWHVPSNNDKIEIMKMVAEAVAAFNTFAQEAIDVYFRERLPDYINQLERCNEALKISSSSR